MKLEIEMTSEMDDIIVRRLLTFPRNNQGQMDAEAVRSLAYLGAAVVLLRQGEIQQGALPGSLPDWVLEGIDDAIIPCPECPIS